jgi:beta-hydroxylase
MWLGIYKAHLPIIVPRKGDCLIKVDKTWHKYKEKKLIMFDETYEHEVINGCNKKRVVLILDVYRRDLPFILQQINDITLYLVKYSTWLSDIVNRSNIKINSFIKAN